MCFVNNEDEDVDIIFLLIKALLPLLHRGGQQKRIDRFVVPLFEEAENARTDAAALRTPTLVIAFRIVIIVLKSGARISIGKGRTIRKNASEKRRPWEDRIRDRLSRDSSASARLPPGLPTGLSSAACGVWCVFFKSSSSCSCFCCRALCALGNLSSLEFYTSFVSFSRLISRRKLTAACARRRSHRRFTGETIAEIGKEALKTIDWSTKTPT